MSIPDNTLWTGKIHINVGTNNNQSLYKKNVCAQHWKNRKICWKKNVFGNIWKTSHRLLKPRVVSGMKNLKRLYRWKFAKATIALPPTKKWFYLIQHCDLGAAWASHLRADNLNQTAFGTETLRSHRRGDCFLLFGRNPHARSAGHAPDQPAVEIAWKDARKIARVLAPVCLRCTNPVGARGLKLANFAHHAFQVQHHPGGKAPLAWAIRIRHSKLRIS